MGSNAPFVSAGSTTPRFSASSPNVVMHSTPIASIPGSASTPPALSAATASTRKMSSSQLKTVVMMMSWKRENPPWHLTRSVTTLYPSLPEPQQEMLLKSLVIQI
ncbi:unnamed protein product [Linum tenue]|uniref:Uncharacterized protein n=1 Tax=Linum tenue TaxID=586396 RepID=A0AAV0QWB8_9ROSI|nr:unnamed protein product [Linum tenue]